jgi:hypothetical protein
MKRILRHRPSPAMVVACVALTVALGGTSYAATRLPKNSVGAVQLKKNSVGTVELKKNAVVSAKVRNRSLLALDFKRGQLPAGPPGSKGDKGDKGDAGAPATNLWASFSAGAFLARSSGVVSSGHPSTGVFTVVFNRDITACAWLAEPASPTGVYYGGGDALTRRFGASTTTLEVTTTNPSGMVSDSVGFTLLVVC